MLRRSLLGGGRGCSTFYRDTVRVLPAEPSPEHCEVAGWGIQGGVVGCSSHVLLLVRDAFGNLRGLREDKHIRLAVSTSHW